MRGTPGTFTSPKQHRGIIPAYAGNTRFSFINRKYQGDHPRVCGEHIGGAVLEVLDWGSSPRMRGTLVRDVLRCVHRRIIPAYAGNTFDCELVNS